MVYFLALTAVKVSILIFYLRAIGTTALTRRLIYFLMAFVVAYGIARVFATLFECRPVSYFWDRTRRGTCVDYHALLTSVTVINMITDVAILVFPMPIVWKLRIPRKQKVSICLVFCVGGLYVLLLCCEINLSGCPKKDTTTNKSQSTGHAVPPLLVSTSWRKYSHQMWALSLTTMPRQSWCYAAV